MPSSKWFSSLSPSRQKAYLKQHKGSKFHGRPLSPGGKPSLGAIGSKPRPMTSGGGVKADANPQKKPVQALNGGDPMQDAPRPPKLVPKASSIGGKSDAKQAKIKGFGNKVAEAMRAALKG